MCARDERADGTALELAGVILPTDQAKRLPNSPLRAPDHSGLGSSEILAWTTSICRGDQAAFTRLYERYSFRLYKFLLVLARGREHQAQEVCQVVWIKLARRFARFDTEAKLWAWLSVVARNAFRDHCRAEARRGRCLPLDDLASAPAHEPQIAHRLANALRETLATLPPTDRELLQAAYVDERPLRVLADESGQTYKAIESRLARLRHKVKSHLLHHLRHESQS